jgi:hypothetical protein
MHRFALVWAAAGTPHGVFAVKTDELIDAVPDARVMSVS